jgi:hypothetical protein
MAAAHDCPKGHHLLAATLFVPVRDGSGFIELGATATFVADVGALSQPLLPPETNKSGTTMYKPGQFR